MNNQYPVSNNQVRNTWTLDTGRYIEKERLRCRYPSVSRKTNPPAGVTDGFWNDIPG